LQYDAWRHRAKLRHGAPTQAFLDELTAVASQVYHNNTEQFGVTMAKEIHKMHTSMFPQGSWHDLLY
jgi:hypothetical protein